MRFVGFCVMCRFRVVCVCFSVFIVCSGDGLCLPGYWCAAGSITPTANICPAGQCRRFAQNPSICWRRPACCLMFHPHFVVLCRSLWLRWRINSAVHGTMFAWPLVQVCVCRVCLLLVCFVVVCVCECSCSIVFVFNEALRLLSVLCCLVSSCRRFAHVVLCSGSAT